MRGVIVTETVVHAAPEHLVAEAPYQIAIVRLDDGKRVTARVDGERVAIDSAVEVEKREDGVYHARALR